MDKVDVEIKIVNSWPEDDIVELYKAGGWWKDSYDSSGIIPLIQGSFAFFVVTEKKSNKAIGMGRIISDGVSDAYLQDIIVLPDYRGQGIGKKLTNILIKHCLLNKLYWIALIAEPDQDGFYKTLGFKNMKDYVPMKFETEE
jgi:ribosomal protein S18 acetylase RimI-like enzyme